MTAIEEPAKPEVAGSGAILSFILDLWNTIRLPSAAFGLGVLVLAGFATIATALNLSAHTISSAQYAGTLGKRTKHDVVHGSLGPRVTKLQHFTIFVLIATVPPTEWPRLLVATTPAASGMHVGE
jgi:hypothetical protein